MPKYENVECKEPDPVFCEADVWEYNGPGQVPTAIKEPGWYFWDEVWCHPSGPFTTEEKCREALVNYAIQHLGYSTCDLEQSAGRGRRDGAKIDTKDGTTD